MVRYFGYGSNINLTSLRAKGVQPLASRRARLAGWTLKFNVRHWFRHEGCVGNIQPSNGHGDFVEGVLHELIDADLDALDAAEAYGFGYDRITISVETENGIEDAFAYVGMPDIIDDAGLPTQRYLNILIRGAEAAGLSSEYIDRLRRHQVLQPSAYPPFDYPAGGATYTADMLIQQPYLTALAQGVFDMRGARPELNCLMELFGGKDMTLFHVKRHDSSTGNETMEDVRNGRISEGAKEYLNAYLHEYAAEFTYVGRFHY